MHRKIAIAVISVLTVFGLIRMASPAYAMAMICGNAGSGYCLNDWNNGGAGNPVKMYNGGVANDNFDIASQFICNGNNVVTSTCPFSHPSLNAKYLGDSIYEVQYLNSGPGHGLCVVPNGSNNAVLESCSSNGVIMITDNSCTGGIGFFLVDRYLSDFNDTTTTLYSGGNIGVQAFFATGNGTCWAQ